MMGWIGYQLKNTWNISLKEDLIPYLYLMIGSLGSLFFSIVIQSSKQLDIQPYIIVFLTFQCLIIIINNIAYCSVVRIIKNQKMKLENIIFYIRHCIPQVICVFVLSILQTTLLTFLLPVLSSSSIITLLASVIISLFFMLMIAHIAFEVNDENLKISMLLKDSFLFIEKNWIEVLFPCLLLILWTFAENYFLVNASILVEILSFCIAMILKLNVLLSIAKVYVYKIK